MTITVYGIKSCHSMKKAFAKLEKMSVSYEFHDYKKQGIDETTIERWVNKLGIDKVLNKRGTTWRKLSDEQKAAADASVTAAIALMAEHSSMIKRPIVEGQYLSGDKGKDVLLCGFDEAQFVAAFNP